MVNLYKLLDIPIGATDAEIKQVLLRCQAKGQHQDIVIEKAHQWLLNPHIRAQYDDKLCEHYPHLRPQLPVAKTGFWSTLRHQRRPNTTLVAKQAAPHALRQRRILVILVLLLAATLATGLVLSQSLV